MRSTFRILYYINRGKVKADGTTAIMCRITIDGNNSVFATGYYCNSNDWNAKTGEAYSWTWRQSLWGSWALWSLSALPSPPDTLLATASL